MHKILWREKGVGHLGLGPRTPARLGLGWCQHTIVHVGPCDLSPTISLFSFDSFSLDWASSESSFICPGLL